MTDDYEWLTLEEAAVLIGVSRRTLYNWRSTGTERIPSYKPGGRVRYKKSEVEAYVESTRHETTAEL